MKAIKRMLYWKRKQLHADVFENEVNGLLQSFFVAFIFWKNTVIYICSGLSSLTFKKNCFFSQHFKTKRSNVYLSAYSGSVIFFTSSFQQIFLNFHLIKIDYINKQLIVPSVYPPPPIFKWTPYFYRRINTSQLWSLK